MKIFVPDTNVFDLDPYAMFKFGKSQTVIASTVIQELNHQKKQMDSERGRNARVFFRLIKEIMREGKRQGEKIKDGITVNDEGGTVRIEMIDHSTPKLKDEYPEDHNDNLILSVAVNLKENPKHKEDEIVFVTADGAPMIFSDLLGLQWEDYESAKKGDIEELHKGVHHIPTPVTMDFVHEMENNGGVSLELLREYLPEADIYPQDFVIFEDSVNQKEKHIGRMVPTWESDGTYQGKMKLKKLSFVHHDSISGIKPKNLEQKMLFEVLLDPKVKLVCVVGQAGSGKTLLSLAAGYKQTVQKNEYKRILAARPIVEFGKGIGYLKGGLAEKIAPWMEPITDNLEIIADALEKEKNAKNEKDDYLDKRVRKPKKSKSEDKPEEEKDNDRDLEKELPGMEKFRFLALSYIRGKSLPDSYFYVDEFQNCSPFASKTILSRLGEGSKAIIGGDIEQIDDPYLDRMYNGLSHVINRMKQEEEVAIVFLNETVRSVLAKKAAELL